MKKKSTTKTESAASKKKSLAKIKLPDRKAYPKNSAVPLFELLNPGGGEIYKLYARYPTKPPIGPCSLWIFWKGGPYPEKVNLALIDIKNFTVKEVIVRGIPNVPPGQIGVFQWTLPAKFQPTDDCPMVAYDPNKYGRYQIYIEDSLPLTWRYGPEFTITFSE